MEFLDGWHGETTDQLLALRDHYEAESLMLAFELALQTASLSRPLSRAEKQVLGIAAFAREMHDGGYAECFTNASRVYAELWVEMLFALGCEQAARITRGTLGVLRVPLTPEALAERMATADAALLALLERSDERYAGLDVELAAPLLGWIAARRAEVNC